MGKESIGSVGWKRGMSKEGAQVEWRRSHLKAIKDLTAGDDGNDNLKSPNFMWN